MEESKRAELEELLLKLQGFRGRHTELVTVYVPAGSNLLLTIKQLEQEKSTASNIKSKSTRNNVMDALDKIARHLRLFKQNPANGLAVFCGNISENEGQSDIQLWAVEPPQPVNIKMYRCDQVFLTEPLEDLLEAKEVYGLIVIDRQDATFGVLEGKNIRHLRNLTSGAPGKHGAGGQSQGRYERAIEEIIKDYYKRVAESAKELFFDMPRLKGLLLGGPGLTKDTFVEQSQLVTGLRNKIIATKSISYSGEAGLKELVNECMDILVKEEIMKEKDLLQKFFTLLASQPKKVTYGYDKVKKALTLGAVEKLIISRSIEKEKLVELKKMAIAISATTEVVSIDTEEGLEFKNIGGIGAILRFDISE